MATNSGSCTPTHSVPSGCRVQIKRTVAAGIILTTREGLTSSHPRNATISGHNMPDHLEATDDNGITASTTQGSQPPEDGDNGQPASSPRHSRRRRSKSGRQLIKVQRTNRNLKIALAVLIMVLTATIVVGKQVQTRMLNRINELEQSIDRLRLKLTENSSLSQKLLEDMNSMVESRLPGLRKLQFDTVIPLSESYVKNVIFAISKDGDETSYEYRFVFFNPKITPVFPRLKLHMFDNRGLEVGSANVTTTGKASEGRVRSLGPGEIRSYNGAVGLIENTEPSYFLLEIGKPR